MYCSSSMRALTALELQIEPRGTSRDMSMMPAPVIAMMSAQPSHRRAGPNTGLAPASSRARMRRRRAPPIGSASPTNGPTDA